MLKKTAAGLLWLCVALTCGETHAGERPRRIVSFNLCTDQLLLALADPDQIAGLSPYATDAALSVTAASAKPYRRLDWDAESIVGVAPDLVLVAPSNRPIRAMLSALGVRVIEVAFITEIDTAKQQAREIGALVGHPDRGAALAQSITDAEEDLIATAPATRRSAMLIGRGGYAEGAASLPSAMLRAAGFRPADDAPRGFGGFVSLEQLIVGGPEMIVTQDSPRQAADQGALFITHPAVAARYGTGRRIDLPARYTLCGGPALREGLTYLKARGRAPALMVTATGPHRRSR